MGAGMIYLNNSGRFKKPDAVYGAFVNAFKPYPTWAAVQARFL